MDNETILSKLNEIRTSMESFKETLDPIRYEDFKTAFCEQVQNIFGEHSRTLFDSGIETMNEYSSCVNKRECIEALDLTRNEVIAAFKRDDMYSGMVALEDAEGRLTYDGSVCKNKRCSRYTLDTLHQIQALLSIADNLKVRNYIQPETSFTRLSSNGRIFGKKTQERKELTSTEVADMVSTLANPLRLEILKILSSQQQSFSEISKALDLRTGHLQFHLKALQRAGYIKNNRRRRSYSITIRGGTALDGVLGLAERLL